MTPQPLPDTPTLIERVKGAMRDAHAEWKAAEERGESGLGDKATQALVRRVWELGFDHPCVYPRATASWSGAKKFARERLREREGAHFWSRDRDREHSTLKEWLYDVAWVEFGGEYAFLKKDRHTADHVPNFKRLVLALESELNSRWPRWHVLTDFNKLLAARAELRVMVWNHRPRAFPDGFALLEPRLRKANGANEGWWLLSPWSDDDGFSEHRVYHDGKRMKDLERAPK